MEIKKIRCIVCGVDENKAKERGISIEKVDTSKSIEFAEGVRRLDFLAFDRESYICSRCKEELVSIIKGSGKKESKEKINAFSMLIDSTACLLGLDVSTVAQACLKIYINEIIEVSDRNLDFSILLMNSSINVLYAVLEELEQKKSTRENEKEVRDYIEKN